VCQNYDTERYRFNHWKEYNRYFHETQQYRIEFLGKWESMKWHDSGNGIALEYEAAMRGLTGLAITAPHEFITARIEEHIAGCHEKLQVLNFTNNPVTL
jgi:hypothetical protein